MTRASGRRGTPRDPGAEFGSWDKGIPGGIRHNDRNKPVEHAEPPRKEQLEPFRGMMAHGVPPADVGHYNREMAEAARHPYHPGHTPTAVKVSPVPVYVVEGGAGAKPLAEAAYHHITLPAAGSEPVSICGQDDDRSLVQLLNESTTHNGRFGQLSDLIWDAANATIIGGAILPQAATGYTVIRTQRPLYGISADSTPISISVILEFEVQGAG